MLVGNLPSQKGRCPLFVFTELSAFDRGGNNSYSLFFFPVKSCFLLIVLKFSLWSSSETLHLQGAIHHTCVLREEFFV